MPMELENLPDHVLIFECRAGNINAFDVLFDRYVNKLHFFALQYLKDYSLTEEIVMDIMARLWEKREGFTAELSLGPYLFRSVKNAIIDHYRKKSLETVLLKQSHEDLAVSNLTEDNFAFYELQKVYQINLEKLSPQRRRVFEMSRHDNMTYPQIAKNLNLSVKTVESHVSAALSYLRKSMSIYSDMLVLILSLVFFF